MHQAIMPVAVSPGDRSEPGDDACWIGQRIGEHASAFPEQLAVSDETSRLNWAQLVARADRLAHALKALGMQPGDCVALYLDRSVDFVVAALGVLKSGAAYLPLDSSTPAQRVSTILTDAQAKLLLSHRGKSQQLTPGAWQTCELENLHDLAGAAPTAPVSPDITAQDLAYVIYTSGSTGQPKGVEITHANLQNLIEWHQEAFHITSTHRASQVAGLGFDAAAWEIWPHLTAGASLHIADDKTRRSPQLLHDWLLSERINISFVPTVLAEQLLNMAWPADTALRYVLTGADTLHRRPGAGLPFALVNNYGPSECTVVATSGIVPPDADASGAPSIGRAISNTTAYILDDALRPVPAGQPGELCLAGAHVGRGYRNSPQFTASRFVVYQPDEGLPVRIYRTGDRARLLENGEIAFLGRVDDQVKIRGYRIELGEIIASLNRHPSILTSAVVVRSAPATGDDAGEKALVAYLVLDGGSALTALEVREFLLARLPDYMVPSQFVVLGALPMTPNGKLDKAALPEPAPNNLLPDGRVQAPASAPAVADGLADAVEPRVAAIVATLLNQPSVGRTDNFFMLGGHSMLGVQLVAKIRDAFGVKLSLRQLFSSPTVAGLSAEVQKLAAAKPAAR